MRRLTCFMWLALVFACRRAPSNQEKMWTDALAEVRSSSVATRANGVGGMVSRCCRPHFLEGYNPPAYRRAACQEVRRLLETETEPAVMAGLIFLQSERPHCYQQFPPSLVVRLCREGCPVDTRGDLLAMLGTLDPSPEIVEALLHQLALPVDRTQLTEADAALGHRLSRMTEDDIDRRVAYAFGDMGELDLWPVLDALASPNPRLRRAATRAFYSALHDTLVAKAPLDMPALLRALERLETDPDEDTAFLARGTARAYRSWGGVSPDEAVAAMVRLHVEDELAPTIGKHLAIRMLAVRRFSCRTKAAADVLAELSADPDPKVAAAARHAIALRAKRCPRLQGN